MKKALKIFGIIIISILGIYILFIIEESIRLKRDGQYPLVILDGGYCEKTDKILYTEKGYKSNCIGLGYSIEREYLLGGQVDDSDIGYALIKEEFWLLDKYLLWGWVA